MRKISLIRRVCFVVFSLGTAIHVLYADDPATSLGTTSDGYRLVPIGKSGGKTVSIRVKSQPDPYKNVNAGGSPAKYDPTSINFNSTSSLANKSFSTSDASVSKSDIADEAREQRSFITKSYFTDDLPRKGQAASNLDTRFLLPGPSPEYNHNATGFDKNYATGSADTTQNQPALYTATTSGYQNREANLGEKKIAAFTSDLGDKTYTGPEADIVRNNRKAQEEGLMQLKDLPNRPLTVDEVRDLINHGFKPNTDAPPTTSSKSLNDPADKPVLSPARDEETDDTVHSPGATHAEENDEGVPSPGTMAAQPVSAPPENSEPLPNKQ